ncbi:BlaI/MecI/CopY family transcriptional regulator [Auritidibacter ignavus]|uniref:BlaI/MecI/CopY family transcriptional regulator n=1 Tax=Auritidibacter ignavus TaxID=678932 RepID=A0AAJ6APM5_9MICC|nr:MULTISPECIES: BlaI/MecI/CopY family transcriptional regulator [Auritidibacter]PXA75894.1 transcriptional regulator [Auritidibacter sp. NML100628]WGH86882.1 BlaI/MecI/CopY family transcriptional regulator [Auritidibacter ignavus]WGH89166.1 BlaI/MecI/CopY family transcriptional regulator [Auritidibacter ignavus]WGH91510.1 BlaI/MecI/CopY family transcriptional regulator [Auritidibacter ignavus]WGH93941.1 BlaI/MecI/CopY family transcriptional regulator [Auritidibacter ignavus]
MNTGSLGQLEQAVMNLLWDSSAPMTANDLRERLEQRTGSTKNTPAITTILTVLSRLTKKGFVNKDQQQRPHTFTARATREAHTADVLHEVLNQAPDRQAVLAQFVGSINSEELATLRSILNARDESLS